MDPDDLIAFARTALERCDDDQLARAVLATVPDLWRALLDARAANRYQRDGAPDEMRALRRECGELRARIASLEVGDVERVRTSLADEIARALA